MKRLIYIGDKDYRISDIFKEKLYSDENLIETFSDLPDVLSKLEKNSPDLILLNENLFPQTKPSREIFANTSLVIYADRMEVEEKLAFYRMGAKRVIIEPMGLVSAVVDASSIILNRHEEFHKVRQQCLNYGILQGYSLQDILQNAFLEKKNLIIKVSNNGWNAKIRILQGHIVNAIAPNLQKEEAVLKTLHLPIGKFIIRRYQKNEGVASVIPSTPAILTQLRSEQKELQEFFEKTGSNNPKFKLAIAEEDLFLEQTEKRLLELIKKYATLQEVQMHSPFPFLKTLRTLSSLFERKLIHPEGIGETFEAFAEKDVQYLQENIFPEDAEEGRIIVMGVPGSGKSDLIQKIAGQPPGKIQSIKYLDFARVKLKENLNLSFLGISIDENFLPVFERLSGAMLAYIFLVDFQQEESFEYTKYLLAKMLQTYDVPLVVGITRVESGVKQALARMRKILEVPDEIALLSINPDSFRDCRELLFNLRKSAQYSEKENANG